MSQAPHFRPCLELLLGLAARIVQPVAGRFCFDRPIAITSTDKNSATAATVLEAVALQLLVRSANVGLHLHLFEARASERFGEIKHLFAATHGDVGRQWFNPREACAGLLALNQRVMVRASLLAAARKSNLYAYNAGRRVAEPIECVLLSGVDALAAQDLAMLHTLQHLAVQGPRCGVVLLLLHDLDAARETPLQPVQRTALFGALGAIVPNAFGIDFSGTLPVPYNLGEPYQRFARDFGYKPEIGAQELQRLGSEYLAVRQKKFDTNPQQDFLRVRIGEAQANDAFFSLGQASYAFNALISGGSGSGKTTFVQNLILSICEQYSPSEIELFLLDYGTVSFGPYRGVAHVSALFDTPRDGDGLAQVFSTIVDLLHQRKESFKACGVAHNVTVDNMETYTRLNGTAFAHVLLVVDEFGSLIGNENTTVATVSGRTMRVNTYAEQCINLLVREGRKVGLHLVLITQSFAKLDRMPQDVKSNPHVAVALKAQEARDSHAILNSENDAAYRIAPFQAVMNRHAGQVAHNLVVDLDYVSESSIAQRQAALRARWPQAPVVEACTAVAQTHVTAVPPRQTADAVPSWMRAPRAASSTQGAEN